MPAFLQNRYVQFIGLGLIVIFGGLAFLMVISSVFSASSGFSAPPSISYDSQGEGMQQRAVQNEIVTSPEYDLPTTPSPAEYTGDLEAFEITSYDVRARTRAFDSICDAVENLMADQSIDFKSLTKSLNHCRATFYVAHTHVERVLNTLTNYDGVAVTRNTKSVTRHRAQLQSQTDILRQQLASIERSLQTAETEFDEIASFARTQNDAKTLASSIREKLNLVETLTQRKIVLTSQIDAKLQQAADLEEQLSVVRFQLNISRSYPLQLNEKSRQWDKAWNELENQFTQTLIGLTAFFGIFMLWAIRIGLYTVVGLVVLRGLWKFARMLWKNW